MNDIEVWSPVISAPGTSASSYGRIHMEDMIVVDENGKERIVKGGIRPQHDSKGYLQVWVFYDDKWHLKSVHRLVAEAFIPNPDNLPQVNHKDCNPTNNYVNNLEWCSPQYNMAYKEKYGTSAVEATKVLRKPLFSVALKTGEVLRFHSQHEAERKMGIANSNINAVLKNRREQAGGYWFCYADDNAVEATRVKLGDEAAAKVAKLMKEN